MGSTIVIRAAVVDDAETLHAALVGIEAATEDGLSVTSTVNDLRRYGFGDKPAFAALIAEADGQTAGVCIYFPSFSTFRGKPGVYVQDLYVDPRWRGAGIGAKLLQRLAAQTRATGGAYIRLSVEADNVAAQGFYDRVGLTHSASERIHAAYGEAFQALADAADETEQ
ncbi:GNAT family N-acetyltransferase [Salmonella enterica subsp. enterica]|nr:GNAT family N-acetyltransferase [Salmonella enterica subsp. enterica serovar Enteritidis]